MYAGRLARAITRVADHDVPRASLRLMAQLDELGPSTVGRLAEADRCSQPTMSAAVSALTDRDWANKRPNPDDARSCLVELTDTGRAVLADARTRNAATIRARFLADPCHGVADLATTVAVLKNLLAQTDPETHTEGAR